jgi:excisionase family DNA binding protein
VGELLTVREVALFLQVHPTTIYHLLKTKDIPSFRVGNAWRFRLEAVETWMKESSVLHKS